MFIVVDAASALAVAGLFIRDNLLLVIVLAASAAVAEVVALL